MTFYITPKDIITDFLRTNLVDPRARSEASNTETFTATASQTTFSLSAPSGSVSCVTSVKVAGVAQTKWGDYKWDRRGEDIIFFTGITLNDAVVIIYKYGSSNWIYSDKPNTELGSTSFPRINILIPSTTGQRLGNYEAPVQSNIHFQVDIWTKEKITGNIFTIGGHVYAGNELVDYIAIKIIEAFEDSVDDLHPAMYDYIPLSAPRDLPFNVGYQSYHGVVEFLMKSLDLGRLA